MLISTIQLRFRLTCQRLGIWIKCPWPKDRDFLKYAESEHLIFGCVQIWAMKWACSAIQVFGWVLVSRVVCIIQIVTVCQLRALNPYKGSFLNWPYFIRNKLIISACDNRTTNDDKIKLDRQHFHILILLLCYLKNSSLLIYSVTLIFIITK